MVGKWLERDVPRDIRPVQPVHIDRVGFGLCWFCGWFVGQPCIFLPRGAHAKEKEGDGKAQEYTSSTSGYFLDGQKLLEPSRKKPERLPVSCATRSDD